MQDWPAFKQHLAQQRHRGLLVIAGEQTWCLQQLQSLVTFDTHSTCLWLGEQPLPHTNPLSAKQAPQWLGQECQQLIINAHSGIDLNAIGALCGTVTASGFAVLLCPAFAAWPQQPDPQSERFYAYSAQPTNSANRLVQHVIATIKADKDLLCWQQHQAPPRWQAPNSHELVDSHEPVDSHELVNGHEPVNSLYKSEQQQLAVNHIIKVATGHRRRPLVLTADRGRGKSSALGIAISQLFEQGKHHIIISAPQVSSVEPAFARVIEQHDIIEQTATTLTVVVGSSSKPAILQFVPPDELIANKPTADIVMIDEAAAIPAPMLSQVLQHYSRIVFTSTIAGYEGTGRSFEIRFKQTLNRLTPNWHGYHMTQPIRFAVNDPLEHFINQALMLDAQASQLDDLTVDLHTLKDSELTWTLWDRDKLIEQPQILSQIIGLLMLSHYKTSANDFRHLLDGNNIQLYTLAIQQHIIGAVLVAIEGQFEQPMCQQIWQGQRRPKGHLLPQTLSCHSGFAAAPQYCYGRIIRIAIHPRSQNQGLGSRLLNDVSQHLQHQGVDFMGSSFGATTALIRFWQNNGHLVVRLGLNKEATSNEHSAIVLKPLAASAEAIFMQMVAQFNQQLPQLLLEFYPLLSSSLALKLLQQAPINSRSRLNQQQQADLTSYLHHKREYEFASIAIYQQTLRAIAQNKTRRLTEQQCQLLVDKVLRKQPWPMVCKTLGIQGKKQAAAALKDIISLMVTTDSNVVDAQDTPDN